MIIVTKPFKYFGPILGYKPSLRLYNPRYVGLGVAKSELQLSETTSPYGGSISTLPKQSSYVCGGGQLYSGSGAHLEPGIFRPQKSLTHIEYGTVTYHIK